MVPVLAEISEWHIFLVLIIVFLLFGGKKLPELARGIGEALKEFKKASRDIHDEPTHTPASQSKPETPPPSAANPGKPVDPKLN